MSQDHLEHVPLVESLVSLARRLEAQPGARRDVKDDLFAVANELSDHFGRHLELEETSIFPAARAFLSNDVLAEMMAEVRARRS
jgi:hemerythrin-like domain-containing protein